jgi:hypothetical protein
MVVRVMSHKASDTHNPPPPHLMQMGGGTRGQKDEGASLKGGVWKGVEKTSHQDTPGGGCGVLVCVGVQWPW